MPDVVMGQPLSRTEAILQNMLGANNVLEPPMSREEYLLLQLLNHIGPSGDYYTKEEIDNMISALEQEIDWKESVATFADLATTYPDAEAGWTASVLADGRIYRYNGTAWIDIYGMIPLATSSVNGLMSSGKVIDLETIKTLLNGHSVASDVPANAVFTDTVYDDTALSGRVTVVEGLLDSHSVASDVPANAVFTDTVYDDTALSGRVSVVEGLLDSHSVGKDVPSDAKFTDTVYDDTELSNRVTELENDTVSKTTTGNPISITDAADAPIVSGEVMFEPKQDLHGYDKPWAGGAGDNQLNYASVTVSNITFAPDSDGYISATPNNGDARSWSYSSAQYKRTLAAGTYNFIAEVTQATTITAQGISVRDINNTEIAGADNILTTVGTHYFSFTLSEETEIGIMIKQYDAIARFAISNSQITTWTPYSNICPITGYDDCEVEVTDDDTTPTVTNTYTIDLAETRYGGKVNPVSGVMTVTQGYIATYAGETIGEPWLSDRDEYVAGTTPTTGAEVVYTLATPIEVQLTPEQIRTLEGTNNISTNMTDMSLEYITQDYQPLVDLANDTLIIAKEYTDEQISLLKKKVYGMRITGNAESDPASKITYLEDAVGMTPAYMDYTTGKFNFGSWADAWFMDGIKPCVLNADGTVYCYLDRNDQTKDVDGNDVTDIVNGTTDFGQNCMVEWPKIWIKTIPVEGDDTSGLVYIAPMKLDDDYHDFPYIDQNGNHKEHFYRPMYNGSVKNGVMRSLLGQQVSKSLNATTEISYCQANGDGWYTETAGEIMLVNFLLILISKSTDTQTVFGKGLSENGSEAINDAFRTGVHSDKGMFYGTKSAEASTYTNAVKVFYTENDWGFQWRRYAGDINASGTRKVKMCWGTEDGSTVANYNTDGAGYVDVGATPSGTSGGYINEMKFTSLGMFSKTSSGSSSTHYCDGQWFNNNQTDYALRGGGSDNGARVGAFYVFLDGTPSGAGWNVGAALSYK